jgi:hypothetical protein
MAQDLLIPPLQIIEVLGDACNNLLSYEVTAQAWILINEGHSGRICSPNIWPQSFQTAVAIKENYA